MHDDRIYFKFNKIIQVRIGLRKYEINWSKKDRFESVFHYCLNSLKEEYRLILLNSYFDRRYEYWWVDYYCKSSYYRKRFWAIASFVRLFEMVYENSNDCSAYLNNVFVSQQQSK